MSIFRRPGKSADRTEVFELIFESQRIPVQVRFDRFRTLRLSVRPEGIVSVRAPHKTSAEYIRAHLENKAAWIVRHLERFRTLRLAAPPLEYLDGEAHAYLGCSYRLSISQGKRNGVHLADGCFEVTTLFPPRPAKVRELMDAWYLKQAREIFPRIIREMLPCCDALAVPRPARLTVRAMTSRWGTCSVARVITLNRHLVRAALPCVEYVVAHELCHLKHHGHNALFYGLLAALMPDWKERKKRLAREVIL